MTMSYYTCKYDVLLWRLAYAHIDYLSNSL